MLFSAPLRRLPQTGPIPALGRTDRDADDGDKDELQQRRGRDVEGG